MSDRQFTVELERKVYDEKSGECIRIGPDPDGADCVRVLRHENNDLNSPDNPSLTFYPEQAKMIAESMIKVADEIMEQEIMEQENNI